MTSSQPSYHLPGPHPMMDAGQFAAYHQTAVPMGPNGTQQAFYGAFPVYGNSMPVVSHPQDAAAVMQARQALQQHPAMHSAMSGASQQQQRQMLMNAYASGSHEFMMQQQQMGMPPGPHHPAAMMSAPQQHFHNTGVSACKQEDSSGEFDDSYGGEEDSMEHMMEMCEDPVMRERLRIVQQAQEEASCEGASGLFACPFCDKEYNGKHARSIWRRHLQDKHAIPLSQQPRRTRWDGDANRPKNAEERRQRMLESKRRWARKKRMMDKVNAGNTSGEKTESMDGDRDSEAEGSGTPLPEGMPLQSQEMPAAVTKAEVAATKPKKRSASGTDKKHRGMQQLKFHHLTAADMPRYANNHTGGAIKVVWDAESAQQSIKNDKNGQAQRVFSKHASMPAMPQQMVDAAMFGPPMSPRRAFGVVDSNADNGRGLSRTVSAVDAHDAKPSKKRKGGSQPTALMPAPGPFEGPARTPTNGFSMLYPAQPLSGDDKSLAARVFGGAREEMDAFSADANALSENNTAFAAPHGKAAAASMSKRHSITMLSPVSSMRRMHQSPASNPFSLDQHRISPATSSTRRITDGFVEPPTSATRLTSALNARNAADLEANRLSPLQTRLGLKPESGSVDMLMMNGGNASPVSKARKLPPLLKTPMRPGEADSSSTSTGGALGFIASGLGSASVRRAMRRDGAATTPTQHERMMAPGSVTHGASGGATLGLTPFDVRQSAKYSVTRASGYYSRASPAKRDGADQFSSPQHLNLTQSLGLAPHSTIKGSSSIMGGMTSLTGTPYVNSFMSSASPWPESVLRPTFRMSASIRGGDHGDDDDDDVDNDDKVGSALHTSVSKGPLGSSDIEGEDDDDSGGVHETPSRPAKRPHPSSLGGSPTSQQQRSSVTRSQAVSAQNNSSASRSRRTANTRRPSELPPLLNFNVSSPAPSTDDKDDGLLVPPSASSTSSKKTRSAAAQVTSFDHALLDADSPTVSNSSSEASSLADIADVEKSV